MVNVKCRVSVFLDEGATFSGARQSPTAGLSSRRGSGAVPSSSYQALHTIFSLLYLILDVGIAESFQVEGDR